MKATKRPIELLFAAYVRQGKIAQAASAVRARVASLPPEVRAEEVEALIMLCRGMLSTRCNSGAVYQQLADAMYQLEDILTAAGRKEERRRAGYMAHLMMLSVRGCEEAARARRWREADRRNAQEWLDLF
jgi:hypothetical protein